MECRLYKWKELAEEFNIGFQAVKNPTGTKGKQFREEISEFLTFKEVRGGILVTSLNSNIADLPSKSSFEKHMQNFIPCFCAHKLVTKKLLVEGFLKCWPIYYYDDDKYKQSTLYRFKSSTLRKKLWDEGLFKIYPLPDDDTVFEDDGLFVLKTVGTYEEGFSKGAWSKIASRADKIFFDRVNAFGGTEIMNKKVKVEMVFVDDPCWQPFLNTTSFVLHNNRDIHWRDSGELIGGVDYMIDEVVGPIKKYVMYTEWAYRQLIMELGSSPYVIELLE